MFESKKTQILIWILRWHEKSTASRQKKFPSRQKNFPKGLEDFAPIFGKLTAPYVMFESKKTQILNWILRWHEKSPASRQKKFPSRLKKFSSCQKKYHCLCDIWKQKSQILIAHQKEDIGQTQNSSLVGQKKFPMV